VTPSASGSTWPRGHGTGDRPAGPGRQAIRTVVAAAGARDGVQTSVDIVDD